MGKKLKKKGANKPTTSSDEAEDNHSIDFASCDDALSEDHTIAGTTTTVESELLSDEFAGEALSRPHAQILETLNLLSGLSAEKRTARRELWFRHLFKTLSQYSFACAEGEELIHENYESVLLPACLFGIRKGGRNTSPAEQYAAARCLETLPIVLGPVDEEYCDAVFDPLRKCVLGTGYTGNVRAVCLRAMTMSALFCGTDATTLFALIDLCEDASRGSWRNCDVPSILRATALDCWSVLCSTSMQNQDIAGDDRGRGVHMLPVLKECLEEGDARLRESAGKTLALIHESRLNFFPGEDDDGGKKEGRWRRGSWDGSEWEVLMDDLQQLVHELSLESSHYMSKKAKKSQRAIFREILSTFDDDEDVQPTETVSFVGKAAPDLTLSSWKEILLLDFVRNCLQGGFQIHLMRNNAIRHVFGLHRYVANEPAAAAVSHNESLTQLEKRLYMSKTSDKSKKKDRDMTKKRRNRTNAKNYFIEADGEDI